MRRHGDLSDRKLQRTSHLCRYDNLPGCVVRRDSDLPVGNLLRLTHLQDHRHLSRLCDLSWDGNVRQHFDLSRNAHLAGLSNLSRYNDLFRRFRHHMRLGTDMHELSDVLRQSDVQQHADLPRHIDV